MIPISRPACLSPTDCIIPSIEPMIPGLMLTTEVLIGSTERVRIISRQALLSPSDEIDNNIDSQEVGKYSSENPRSISSSPPHVPIHSKATKIKLKKDNQLRNKKLKEPMHNVLKTHRKMLSDDGFMNDENLSDLISNPSFLGMHSLLEGLSIVMFSRIHCITSEFGNIHRSHGCRLILGPIFFVT